LRRRILLVAIIGAATLSLARAASDNDDRRGHESNPAPVPLQPFSFDPPAETRKAIRVAYYAPRAIPRAQPNYSEDDTDEDRPVESNAAHPTVPGNHAVLRGGVAYAPANAPYRVKAAIWAVNSIRHKPYHWGGGHGSFYDSGYDCSGSVSFALHFAGVLDQPLPSSDLVRYGERGRGRWITVYSRRGHTFAVIAGLRLDTTDFRYGGDVGPRWYTEERNTWGFSARHPSGL
jgi:cell wall-associated NlpC family hydrolase